MTKKLLCIIGMQEGFRAPASEALVQSINNQMNKFADVCHFRFINPVHSLFETQLHWTDFQSEAQQAYLRELKVCDQHHHITHDTYGIYHDAFKALLITLEEPTIYFAGVFTDVCIVKAAMDLFDNQRESFVLSDLCASLHGDLVHQSCLYSLKQIIGANHVITTQML